MFWNTLKQMQGWGREKRDPSTLIPPDKWATHFKQLLNSKLTQDLPTIESMGSTIFDPHCDRRITLKELSDVLQRAKNGKASGPDGVLLEYIKYATPEVIGVLLTLMNKIFCHAKYPADWSVNYLKTIFKKGLNDDPDNYRGLAIGPALSKIYSMILLQRLEVWVTEERS